MHLHRPSPRSWCALALALAGGSAPAQPMCDSLHTVNFTWQAVGGTTMAFAATPPAQGTIAYTEWAFVGDGFQDWSGAALPEYTFPNPGDHAACLLATVWDPLQGQCISAACHVVPVPVDSNCAGVLPAFTIDVQGGNILFIDQTQSDQAITGVHWDFGDGTSSDQPAPTHAYGTGAFEACLTVSSDQCVATTCNWIYLGPSNVPCGEVLQAVVNVVQAGPGIACFNHSTTSGMEHSISWDFGDGGTAVGSPVVHVFEEEGDYEVCAKVDTWGPLAPDTCTATTCTTVHILTAAGVGEPDGRAVRTFPVPFNEVLFVEGLPANARWELMDVQGRRLREGIAAHAGTLAVPCGPLAPGQYLLRIATPGKVEVQRVVKCGSD